MDTEEYDEFGNPINGESDSDTSSSSSCHSDNEEQVEEPGNQLVLPEDRHEYPSTLEVFGEGVETIVATEDARSINQPTVQPSITKTFEIEEKGLPDTTYSKQYLRELLSIPSKVRNVALLGAIHSGKTSILDMFIEATHKSKTKGRKPLRYTDTNELEVKRGISIKSTTMSLLLTNSNHNSIPAHILDAPGHTNFIDEVVSAVRLVDGILLVVDVIQGVTKAVEMAIELALSTRTKICLVLSKMDRLILEMRYRPIDAYYKVRSVIDQVNRLLPEDLAVSPVEGDVCFASSVFGTTFTLQSFAKSYIEHNGSQTSEDDLVSALWGDVYYIEGKFTAKPKNAMAASSSRTFVKFILEPLYKVTMNCLGLNSGELETFVQTELGIKSIKHSHFKLDPPVLLKEIVGSLFGTTPALADMIEKCLPSPVENSMNKLDLYQGSNINKYVTACDPNGPLIAYVSKLVPTADGSRFYAEVRVLSGTLSTEQIKVLGEDFSEQFDDDIKVQDIKKTFLDCARYRIPVDGIPAGSIGLISGHDLDNFITKTATIFDKSLTEVNIFKPLERFIQPVFKVAVQPYSPTDTLKFIAGLKDLNRAYPGCEIRVEEDGQHAVLGYGELYLDCLLHDLRKLYAKVDIKVSDPMTRFAETCNEISAVKLNTESNNGKNSITIIAEPLDPHISVDLERGVITRTTPDRALARHFRSKYDWDSLAARSIWAFGPEENHSTAILCDDTLPEEVDKEALKSVKEAVIQGFKWAAREGPLCDEPIRDVRFRIIDAQVSPDSMEANNVQIIQMARKACYAAMMTATPKLLEPMFEVDIECFDVVSGRMGRFLEKRRGHVEHKSPIDGTQLYNVIGELPVIESSGLETDIRLLTQGKANCELVFSRWHLTPGNPLDSSCFVPTLEPAPNDSLARDFTMKTRKRKGVTGEPSLKKYVDASVWHKLQAAGLFQ